MLTRQKSWGCLSDCFPRGAVTGHPANRSLTQTLAPGFGQFLCRRYKDKAIIWILGGDRSIQTDDERAIIDALAAGLESGDGRNHLKTYHPTGPGFSSIKLNGADWLDFNMFQSSHGAHDHDNGLFVEHDYALNPPKPTLDGEPRYEGMPVGFYFKGTAGIDRFDDYDARQAAYWSVLAGACGPRMGTTTLAVLTVRAQREKRTPVTE